MSRFFKLQIQDSQFWHFLSNSMSLNRVLILTRFPSSFVLHILSSAQIWITNHSFDSSLATDLTNPYTLCYCLCFKTDLSQSGHPGLAGVNSSSSDLNSVRADTLIVAAQKAHENHILKSRWLPGIVCEEQFILWAWVGSRWESRNFRWRFTFLICVSQLILRLQLSFLSSLFI